MKLEFQAVNWEARDLDDDDSNESQFVISVFGKTRDGQSVCVHTEFNPYFFVKNKSPDECWSLQKYYDKDANMADNVRCGFPKKIFGDSKIIKNIDLQKLNLNRWNI